MPTGVEPGISSRSIENDSQDKEKSKDVRGILVCLIIN